MSGSPGACAPEIYCKHGPRRGQPSEIRPPSAPAAFNPGLRGLRGKFSYPAAALLGSSKPLSPAIAVAGEFLQTLGCGILEAREFLVEFEIDFSHWAVTLLGDDDLRLASVLFFAFAALIVLFPVYEHDH